MANKYVQNRFIVLVDQNLTTPARRSWNFLIPSVVIATALAIGFAFRGPLADAIRSILS